MAERGRQNLKLVEEGGILDDRDTGFATSSGVGALLRSTRVRAGIDLRDAADLLKIQDSYLLAIEEGRFSELPGPTYALGFIRAYADFLDLDSDLVIRQFKEEGQGLARRSALVFPQPIQEGRFPGSAALMVAVVLASIAYGGWYYYQSKNHAQIAAIPPVPPSLGQVAAATDATPGPAAAAAPAAAPAPAAAAEPRDAEPPTVANAATLLPEHATAAPPPPAPIPQQAAPSAMVAPIYRAQIAGVPVPPEPGNVSGTSAATPGTTVTAALAPSAPAAGQSGSARANPAPATSAANAEPAPQPAKPGRTFGETADARVLIGVKQETWVQVRDRDGNVLFSRVLHPGDSYRVPNRRNLTLLAGNNSDLDVTVDGVHAQSLPPVKAGKKSIALDADRILAGAVQ